MHGERYVMSEAFSQWLQAAVVILSLLVVTGSPTLVSNEKYISLENAL